MLAENPICAIEGCDELATIDDHIVPLAEGGDREDRANRQGLCRWHDDEKTKREAARGRHPRTP